MTKDEARAYLKEYVKKNGRAKGFAYDRGRSAASVYEAIRQVSPWLAKEAGLKVKRVIEYHYEEAK